MATLGLAVPPGFVVTNQAFREFLETNELTSSIAARLRGLDVRDYARIGRIAQEIRALVMETPIPEHIRAEVLGLREALLLDTPLAVRSSAVGEDDVDASFAGQLDSCLDVRTAAELEHALRTCWGSYWSERSLFYQLSRGHTLAGMGVVVQALVRPTIAGVLFTQTPDPTPGGSDQMVGEYCLGFGDRLVAGEVNPGRFTIARTDFRAVVHALPEQASLTGTGTIPDVCQLEALGRTGLALERAFGGPQDIEWAIDDRGQLFFFQSRPITTPTEPSGVLWSNANVNENFPAPISPLLYSIASRGYYYYFRNLGYAFGFSKRRIRAMEHALRHIIGVHGARMYYNLTNIHAVLRMAPFGDRLTEFFNRFVGANGIAARPRYAQTWRALELGCLRQLGELAMIGVKTVWQYLFLPRRIAAFERTILEFAHRTRPATLERRSLPDLGDELRGFLHIRCHRWTNAALADAASMICYGFLSHVLKAAFPAAEDAALPNTLLKGLPDIVSNAPTVDLWTLSRKIRENDTLAWLFAEQDNQEILARLDREEAFTPFRQEFDRFLEEWGFRCPGELMLTVPSFQENPVLLLEILKSYIRLDGESPVDTLQRQARERASATAAVLGALSWPRRWLVRRLLRWTQRAIALRERARLKQALLYSRCRHIVLAMGDRLVMQGHLAHREDVFFLTWEELDALVSGTAMFPYHVRRLVAHRRAEHAVLGAMTPPDTFVLSEGVYLPQVTESEESATPDPPGCTRELTGTAACGGRVTARAAVLSDPSEAARLTAGDVLVTRQTDPGWGPLFFLIGGLVIERGGMLSHGAILAREFGIPSVVGIREVTQRIPHGKTVTVDGNRGVVRLMD